VRRVDSLENGAFIGMGVGGGLALTACSLRVGRRRQRSRLVRARRRLLRGRRRGLGVVIDAMIPGKKLVAYRRSRLRRPVPCPPLDCPGRHAPREGLALAFSF